MDIKIFVNEDKKNAVKNYKQAIELAGKKFVDSNIIYPKFVDACVERENEFPTGLSVGKIGIAIPHGNPNLVKSSGISFLRLRNPVFFGKMEDRTKKVSCYFLFNLALKDGNEHLDTLRRLVKLFQKENFIDSIFNLPIYDIKKYLKKELDN